MKKTQLTRKTPLRRTGALKPSTLRCKLAQKRTTLKPRSPSKTAWALEYRKCHRADANLQRPVDTPHLLVHKDNQRVIQRHHPFGQAGDAITVYLYISEKLHTWIHDHGTESRALGWLQGPFGARPIDPDAPRPWPVEAEKSWPEEYRRDPVNQTSEME